MGWPGSEYCHPGVLACCLEAGNGLVMAVNNIVLLGLGGSGCKRRGWEQGWGAVGLSGASAIILRGLVVVLKQRGQLWWWFLMTLLSLMGAVQPSLCVM